LTGAAAVRSRRRGVPLVALRDGLLAIGVFVSFFVMMEPSPNELFVAAGLLVILATGVHLPRSAVPMIWLLFGLNVGGVLSALPVFHKPHVPVFVIISLFLMAYAVFFLCLMSENTLRRLSLMRTAWIAGATLAALCGIAGYFNIGGTRDLFTLYGSRAKGTFNDPNVFGPFLILPMLAIVQALLAGTTRRPVLESAALLVLTLGLFLSFSRAAWAHGALSLLLLVALMTVTTQSVRLRARIATLLVAGVFGLAVLIAALVSIDEVRDVLVQRASLNQEYDTRAGGRFDNLRRAVDVILANPNGIGPHEFGRRFGEDPHNAFLHTFVAYGWLGGISYLCLVIATLWVGWRFVFARTVYQPALIVAVSTFTVLAAVGLVIHSDHWRHFYLLVALIWALGDATRRDLAGHRHPLAP
jgi:O-antigen ligase